MGTFNKLINSHTAAVIPLTRLWTLLVLDAHTLTVCAVVPTCRVNRNHRVNFVFVYGNLFAATAVAVIHGLSSSWHLN